jgi:hypothetical protein
VLQQVLLLFLLIMLLLQHGYPKLHVLLHGHRFRTGPATRMHVPAGAVLLTALGQSLCVGHAGVLAAANTAGRAPDRRPQYCRLATVQEMPLNRGWRRQRRRRHADAKLPWR